MWAAPSEPLVPGADWVIPHLPFTHLCEGLIRQSPEERINDWSNLVVQGRARITLLVILLMLINQTLEGMRWQTWHFHIFITCSNCYLPREYESYSSSVYSHSSYPSLCGNSKIIWNDEEFKNKRKTAKKLQYFAHVHFSGDTDCAHLVHVVQCLSKECTIIFLFVHLENAFQNWSWSSHDLKMFEYNIISHR